MKTLIAIATLAAAMVLGDAAVVSWTGDGVRAQGSSACYQTCVRQYNWPAEQCRRYCRGKS
jgi:hypothetical protein